MNSKITLKILKILKFIYHIFVQGQAPRPQTNISQCHEINIYRNQSICIPKRFLPHIYIYIYPQVSIPAEISPDEFFFIILSQAMRTFHCRKRFLGEMKCLVVYVSYFLTVSSLYSPQVSCILDKFDLQIFIQKYNRYFLSAYLHFVLFFSLSLIFFSYILPLIIP